MSPDLAPIFCVDRSSVFPGSSPVAKGVEREWVSAQYFWADFVSPLTKGEADFLVWNRLVASATYSMQQSDFERMGFEVVDHSVRIPPGFEVIGLGTEDRYGIFEPETPVTFYESLLLWRMSKHHPLGGDQ